VVRFAQMDDVVRLSWARAGQLDIKNRAGQERAPAWEIGSVYLADF